MLNRIPTLMPVSAIIRGFTDIKFDEVMAINLMTEQKFTMTEPTNMQLPDISGQMHSVVVVGGTIMPFGVIHFRNSEDKFFFTHLLAAVMVW